MAIPSVLLQLARNHPMTQQIKQMYGMVKTAQNPQAMMNQLMMNNPQFKQVMDIVNQYGGNPDKALSDIAQQYGITEKDIYDLLN